MTDHLEDMFTRGYKGFIAKQNEDGRPDQVKRDEVLVLEFLASLHLNITVDYEPNINGKHPDLLVSSPHFGSVLVEIETFTAIDEFLADKMFNGATFSIPPVQDPTLLTSLGEEPAGARTWADDIRVLLEDAREQFGRQTDYPTLVLIGTSNLLFMDSIDALAAALAGYWLDVEGGGEVLVDQHLHAKGYEATGLLNTRDHNGQLRTTDLTGAAVLAPDTRTNTFQFWSRFNGAAERPLPATFADAMIALHSDIVPVSGGIQVRLNYPDEPWNESASD